MDHLVDALISLVAGGAGGLLFVHLRIRAHRYKPTRIVSTTDHAHVYDKMDAQGWHCSVCMEVKPRGS